MGSVNVCLFLFLLFWFIKMCIFLFFDCWGFGISSAVNASDWFFVVLLLCFFFVSCLSFLEVCLIIMMNQGTFHVREVSHLC